MIDQTSPLQLGGGFGVEQRKKIHIPLHDVDDLAFKNRHDPNFVASISNLDIIFLWIFETILIPYYNMMFIANIMQVPATITLNNGSAGPRPGYSHFNEKKYAMDIPEKLTGKILDLEKIL